MSLGSRIARRAKATVSTGLASTPREPLLFLYPSWSRSSSSTSAKPIREQSDGHPGVPPRPNPVPTYTEPLSFKDQFDSLEQQFKAAKEDAFKKRQAQSNAEQDDLDTLISTQNSHVQASPLVSTLDSTVGLLTTPSAEDRSISAPVFLEKASKKDRLGRKVKQISSTSVRTEQIPQNSSNDENVYKQHLQQMKEELDEPLIDWRDILSDLSEYTPRHGPWLEKALRVIIPQESMERLVHAIDGHIWEIAGNYGCSVNSDGEAGSNGQAFIVSGTLITLGKLTADLTLAAPNLQIFSAGQRSNLNPASKFGSLQNGRGRRYPISRAVKVTGRLPADKISRPAKWTPENFLDHVRAIMNPAVSNHVRSTHLKDVSGGGSRQVQILTELFEDPDCTSSITRTACHEAMEYFVRVNRIQDLRILFVRMSEAKMHLNTQTFNIMLRGAAKTQNLLAFRFILHLMLNRGFVPNPGTWLAFIEAHSDVAIRGHVFDSMKEKGLVGHKSTVKGIAFSLISDEIETSLNHNESQKDFVAGMDARYTPHWLSVWTGSRILHALAGRGLISRCWEFLHFMQSRNIQPNTVCINTVIYHCKEQRNLTGIIELLRSLPPTSKYVPNEETFNRLFDIAWQAQNYNLIRVVWRYACLYGFASFSMRHRMFQSIKSAGVWNPPANGRARFRQLIGPVTFGHSYYGEHPTQVSNRNAPVRRKPSFTASAKPTAHVALGTRSRSEETVSKFAVHVTPDEQAPRDIEADQGQMDFPWVFDIPGEEGPEPVVERYSNRINRVEEQENRPSNLVSESGARPPVAADLDVDVSDGYKEPIFPFNDLIHGRDTKYLPSSKIKLLQDLIMLDHKVYQNWMPVRPMSSMLVEAAEKDKEWRHLQWEAKQRGDVEMTEEKMYSERQRMIDDAVSIEVQSRDGLLFREWK